MTDDTKTTSSTGGIRFNKGKVPVSLCPEEIIEAVAIVFWLSADINGGKYPLKNWEKGLSWVQTAESAMRHLQKWSHGENLDPESGLPHPFHAACNLAMILRYMVTHPELDDRSTEYIPSDFVKYLIKDVK